MTRYQRDVQARRIFSGASNRKEWRFKMGSPSLFTVAASINRLAKSRGYTIPRGPGTVTRIGPQMWRASRMTKADGSPAPDAIIRVVNDRMIWEAQT